MPRHFALVGDVTVTHAGGISSPGDSLTLGAYTTGGRYLPALGHSRLQPFGQVLVGFAHSSGSLVENQSGSTAGNAFAANVGGGLDVRANRRFSIRMIEVTALSRPSAMASTTIRTTFASAPASSFISETATPACLPSADSTPYGLPTSDLRASGALMERVRIEAL
jgi:hypothetical protein